MDLFFDNELGCLYTNVGLGLNVQDAEAQKIAQAPNFFLSKCDLEDILDNKVSTLRLSL